jgi:hypothetical protein
VNRAESATGNRERANPYRSFTIFKQRLNLKSIKLCVLSQLAVFPTYKPFSSANPKRSIARGEQPFNIAARELLSRRGLPGNAPNSIEAKQAELRPEPQITVGRLSDRSDEAIRNAIARRPRRVRVLADMERWIQRESKGAARQQNPKGQQRSPWHVRPVHLVVYLISCFSSRVARVARFRTET